MKNKVVLSFTILVIAFLLTGCESDKPIELNIVPHSLNVKVFDDETKVGFYLVANQKVDLFEDNGLDISYKMESSMESFKLSDVIQIDEYKDYYIYKLDYSFFGVNGSIECTSLSIKVPGLTDETFTFETDLVISSRIDKEVHLYTGSDSADVIVTGFVEHGLKFTLKSDDTFTIKNVYFENTSESNLNTHVISTTINETEFSSEYDYVAGEIFDLEIEFKSDTPKNMYYIDQIAIDYTEDGVSTKQAYVLVPILLGSGQSAARGLIDSLNY